MLRDTSLSQTSVFWCEQHLSFTFTSHELFRSRILLAQVTTWNLTDLSRSIPLLQEKMIPEYYHLCVELCISESVCMFSTSAVLLPVGGQRLSSAILLLRGKLGFRIDAAFTFSRS